MSRQSRHILLHTARQFPYDEIPCFLIGEASGRQLSPAVQLQRDERTHARFVLPRPTFARVWLAARHLRFRLTRPLDGGHAAIKGRTLVAGLFAYERSLPRLVSAVITESSDHWKTGNSCLGLANQPQRLVSTRSGFVDNQLHRPASQLPLPRNRQNFHAPGRHLACVGVTMADQKRRLAPRGYTQIAGCIFGGDEIFVVDESTPNSFEPFESVKQRVFKVLAAAMRRSQLERTRAMVLKASSLRVSLTEAIIHANATAYE